MNQPRNILIVDDEPQMLRYMQILLELDHHRVETALSGSQALERIQKEPPPDLVLLDVLMPGLDGLQTLKCLRALRPDLKAAILSCVSDPPHGGECNTPWGEGVSTQAFPEGRVRLFDSTLL